MTLNRKGNSNSLLYIRGEKFANLKTNFNTRYRLEEKNRKAILKALENPKYWRVNYSMLARDLDLHIATIQKHWYKIMESLQNEN